MIQDSVNNTACNKHPDNQVIFDLIASQLVQRGWCVITDFIPSAEVTCLRNETLASWQSGNFSPASIGQGTSYQTNNNIRSDHIKWIDNDLSASQQYYLEQMEQLRLVINRSLYLGLFSFECHQTVYPPGCYYKKHLDLFLNNNSRALTTILYLNPDWLEEDGGELVLYLDQQSEHEYEIIQPLSGQLVCFLSDTFPHEVKPARRKRISITGWFCRRELHN